MPNIEKGIASSFIPALMAVDIIILLYLLCTLFTEVHVAMWRGVPLPSCSILD